MLGIILLIGISRDDYRFCLIRFGVLFRVVDSLFSEVLKTVCYNFFQNSYEVDRTGQYSLMEMSRLLDYNPLGIYKIGSKTFAPLRHFVYTKYNEAKFSYVLKIPDSNRYTKGVRNLGFLKNMKEWFLLYLEIGRYNSCIYS